ncbi:MAG: CRTAC1 family protein, partial [Verrucomicrobiota bacterium]|nr:CRTAC1 family protein [Verrucomicrobiota bacterium]
GDYDNDGLPDVYCTAVGSNRIYRNLGGGKFTDTTRLAGLAGGENEWSTSAAFADIDNDGDLDLFVCNYVRWSREIDFEVNYTLIGVGRAYGPPTNFQGAFPSLFRNDGDGKFTDISRSAGVQIRSSATKVPMAKSLGVSPVDLDEDGWVDFVVANDTVHNFVFKNKKNGTFSEMGGISGIGFDNNGKVRGAMGIDIARFRNDNTLGVGIGNFANEMVALYVSTPNNQLLFTDNAITEGVGPDSRLLLKFGLFFFDYDLDGWQDLLTSNGHLEEEITKVQKSQTYAQSAQLFWNCGATPAKGGFAEVNSGKAGLDLFKPIVGRGSAFADIDADGDLDVVFTQLHGKPLLLRNDQALNNHWLRVKLVGNSANRDGVGSMVRLRSGDVTQWRLVTPVRSYMSQSETIVTFGLGADPNQIELEVLWPGGLKQILPVSKFDTTILVKEP